MTDDRQGQDEQYVIDNRIGPNFGKPIMHRECSQTIAAMKARLDALEAERDEWRAKAERQAQLKADFRAAYQAAQQAGYDMEALRDRAEQERDALAARLAAAEAALRLCDDAITAGVAELPRGGYTGGGEQMYSETWRNFHRAREAARAALAGSREQAAEGEGA